MPDDQRKHLADYSTEDDDDIDDGAERHQSKEIDCKTVRSSCEVQRLQTKQHPFCYVALQIRGEFVRRYLCYVVIHM